MMRLKKGKPILGIDINPATITVVEMRGAWPTPTIVAADSIPTPEGAVGNKYIARPEEVGGALRTLIGRMGVRARDAVIGLSSAGGTTRILDIPSVPDEQEPLVVEGEVMHKRILREPGGAFDYLRLERPTQGEQTAPRALVMAAEQAAIGGPREVAECLGIRLVAAEPVLAAMLRAAGPPVFSSPAALCVAVGATESEISIVADGAIRLYRRIDTGAAQLLAPGAVPWPQDRVGQPLEPTAASAALRHSLRPDSEDEPGLQTGVSAADAGISGMAASGFALEIQRSLDYYRREAPEASPILSTALVTDRPALEPLAHFLAGRLQMDVALTPLPYDDRTDEAVMLRLLTPQGRAFTTAIGLAMHNLADLPPGVPCLNLLVQNRTDRSLMHMQRLFSASATVSAVLLLGGIVSFARTSAATGERLRATERGRAVLIELQQRQAAGTSRIQKQKDLLARLRLDGLPFPRVIDGIAGGVPDRVGLTGILMDKTGLIKIDGEAGDDRAVILFLDNLKVCPLLENTSLDSFDNAATGRVGQPVRFSISAQLVGVKRALPPAAPAPGAENS